jgi:hypothetical protein
MNEKWIKLINFFEKNGYQPNDIAMRVHFYDLMISQHQFFKKHYEEDED